MILLQQIIALVSEPPGNLIYHLLTLFALQVIFAIAYTHRQNDPDDEQALRLCWAAGGIFAARLLLLLIGFTYRADPARAVAVLPPLEAAVDAVTTVLLLWSLLPRPARYPRLLDSLLVAALALVGVMALFFVQDWQGHVAAGNLDYRSTVQAAVWGVVQIVLLASGLFVLGADEETRPSLAPILVTVLLLAHVAHFWSLSARFAVDTNVAYWVRLGYLVVFPLWAVYAYGRTVTPLIATQRTYATAVAQFNDTLAQAAGVIATPHVQRRVLLGQEMVTATIDAAFVAVGLRQDGDDERLRFTSTLAGADGAPRSWTMHLANWPAFQLAFAQRGTVELQPEGVGARQLYAFYTALKLIAPGALLVHPLLRDGVPLGVLIVAGDTARKQWPEEERALLPGLARYLAQAIYNAQRRNPTTAEQATTAERPATAGQPAAPTTAPPSDATAATTAAAVAAQRRLQELEAERERLLQALAEAEARADKAEKKARDLANFMQQWGAGSRRQSAPEPHSNIVANSRYARRGGNSR